jgi:meiotically up-regulated gene 157 (Mug157) protein
VRALKQLAELSARALDDGNFAGRCASLADTIEKRLTELAVAVHPHYGEIYAYEIDGFGNKLFMDDANIPSLLSLPYLECCAKNDAVYRATRRFVLGEDNPYYFEGGAAEGVGSPHAGLMMVWPLSIIMRALTSENENEIRRCLVQLKRGHAGTGFMHESFHVDDPAVYTRGWFAWANSLFGELIVNLVRENPALFEHL